MQRHIFGSRKGPASRKTSDAVDLIIPQATGPRRVVLLRPSVDGLCCFHDKLSEGTVQSAVDGRRGEVPPVLLALDEVANIAPLPDLPNIVAEGGSQGLVTLACLQDLSQARARWGDAAEGFGSLFGATVVLPGIGDVRTLRAISARCGDEAVAVRSDTQGRSGYRGRSQSVTWSTRRQPRLGVDEIAEGRAGQALVIKGSQPAHWVTMTPWYSSEPWRSRAGPEVVAALNPVAAHRSTGIGGRAKSAMKRDSALGR